jgi:hypothetical protein
MLYAGDGQVGLARHKEADLGEPEKKIRARVQKSKRVFVHNDLSHAAMYFADNIQDKLDKGSRDAIMFDGMACAVMVAFTFEANVNFMGSSLRRPATECRCICNASWRPICRSRRATRNGDD